MSKTRYIVRPNPRLQKLQREYRKQQGVYKSTYLAKVDGAVRLPGGLFWVHDPAGTDGNGNTIYGAPRKMPMLAGAAILPRPNIKVDVVTVRGVDYIARTNKGELDRMGVETHQSNSLDPATQFKSLDWITNLQAFKTPGASSTHIIGSIYKKPDGTYDVFPTTGGYDFVTANIPSTDTQVVVCQWLDTDTNTITTTVSSEESRDTDLKSPANLATTLSLINECLASAPSQHAGIWAWRIFDDTTIATLDDNNKLADLRGIVGGMDVSGDLIANTLVLNDGSELTLDANTDGVITVIKARHTVDTFDDEATGDLATINGLAANEVCILTAADTTRTVVIKDGADNVVCVTGADITLDDNIKAVVAMGSIDGTEVWVYPLYPEVTLTNAVTLSNKTISASANTLVIGTGVSKTISDPGDAVAAGTDRNLVISANSGTTDNLIEVTGLSVGETVYLRAASGHTITVVHNSGSATVKIHLFNNANISLDEQNPLKLTLVATNVLSQDMAGATVTAPLTLTGTTDANQLVVVQNATQTANPVEIRDSAGNDQIVFTPDGGAQFNVEENNANFIVNGINNEVFRIHASQDNVGITDSSPHSSSVLEVSHIGAVPRGVLLPRMNSADRESIVSPADALTVYDTDYDMYFARHDAASAWDAVGAYTQDGMPFTDPNLVTWNDLNQGSGTFTDTDTANRRLHIVGDGNATRQVRGWYTAAPDVPYSIRMYIGGWSQEVAEGSFLGVGFRQDSTTELVVLEFASNTSSGSLVFALGKWNSPTSFNSNYIAGTDIHILPNWIKLEDDNTNRIISVSWDGIAWTVLHTIGRTDFLTADGIFFGCVPSTNATYDFNGSLLSYEQL